MIVKPEMGGSTQLAVGSGLIALLVLRVHFVYVERFAGDGSPFAGGSPEMALAAGVTTLGVCALLVAFNGETTDTVTTRAIERPLRSGGVGLASLLVAGIALMLGARLFEATLLGIGELGVLPVTALAFGVSILLLAAATGVLLFFLAIVFLSTAIGYLLAVRVLLQETRLEHAVILTGITASIVVVIPVAWIAIEVVLAALAIGSLLQGMSLDVSDLWAEAQPDERLTH